MNDDLKIYFARSIRGNPDSEEYQQALSRYDELINHLKNYGQVLTEHFSNKDLSSEDTFPDKKIHDRDVDWLDKADCIVAEVSVASHGVGYEIGRWGERGLKILCLHQKSAPKLSAMIRGSDIVNSIIEYETIEQAFEGIDVFINEHFLKE